LLAAVAILGVFSTVGLLATNFQIWQDALGNYDEAVWPGTGPNIIWNLNFISTPNNVTDNSSGVTPSSVITSAFNTWATATYHGSAVTNIGFTFGTASASLPQAPAIDCQNVIGFADTTTDAFPTGVIAFASIAHAISPNGTVPFTGPCGPCPLQVCIIDVDIMFNPGATFATSSATAGQYDLQSVAMHEIGHLMGLDHSAIAHAVMYPYGDTTDIGIHQSLWTDDMIGASHLYPGTLSPNATGIKGQVTVNGAGVYAAHVEALDATTGDAITDTLTDPAGNFHLRVFNGTYYVYVQSLAPDTSHGPCTIVNFTGQAGYGSNNSANIPSNPTNYTGKYY
jgi:hypothetical protein